MVVPVHASDGDVGSLAQTFNNMIVQIRTQRDEILSAKDQIDDRRRFTEAVLSGVSAGVVGVDAMARSPSPTARPARSLAVAKPRS